MSDRSHFLISTSLLLGAGLLSSGWISAAEKTAEPSAAATQPAVLPPAKTADAPDEVEPPAPALTLVDWADRMLGYLHTDEDNQAESGIKVVSALLETGQLAEARALAAKIMGYRGPAQLYRVAEHYAKANDAEAAASCRAQAQGLPPGERDFERETVMVARIQALAAAGEIKQARAELGNLISEPARQESEAGLFEYDRDDDVAARVTAYAEKEPVAPSLRGKALLLVAESHFAAGHEAEAADYAERAILMVCKLADPQTIPLLHRASCLLALPSGRTGRLFGKFATCGSPLRRSRRPGKRKRRRPSSTASRTSRRSSTPSPIRGARWRRRRPTSPRGRRSCLRRPPPTSCAWAGRIRTTAPARWPRWMCSPATCAASDR
jgi:hypothetical protein